MGGRLAAAIVASLVGHAALAALALLAPIVPRLFPAPAPQEAIAFEVVKLAAPVAPIREEPSGGAPAVAALRPSPHGRQLRLAAQALSALAERRGPESVLAGLHEGPRSPELDSLVRAAGLPASPGAGALAIGSTGGGMADSGRSRGAEAELAGGAAGDGGAARPALAPGGANASSPGTGGGGKPSGVGGGGSGRTAGAGTGGGSHAAVVARLRARAALCYPRAAQRREVEGIATVRFCVDASGSPTEVKLARTSGSSALDGAAVECVVRGAAPLPQPPAAEPCMSVPVLFRLR